MSIVCRFAVTNESNNFQGNTQFQMGAGAVLAFCLVVLGSVPISIGENTLHFKCMDVDLCRTNVSWCNERENRCELCSDYIQACFTESQPKGCAVYCMEQRLQKEMLKRREQDCPLPPNPENGFFHGNNNFGGEITYGCNEGFVMVGPNNASCKEFGRWSKDQMPHCEVGTCSKAVYNLQNGHVEVTNNTFGSVARFACNSGYSLHGSSSAECLNTGIWYTKENPFCTQVSENMDMAFPLPAVIVTAILFSVSVVCNIYCFVQCLRRKQKPDIETGEDELGTRDDQPLVRTPSKGSRDDSDSISVEGKTFPDYNPTEEPSAPPGPLEHDSKDPPEKGFKDTEDSNKGKRNENQDNGASSGNEFGSADSGFSNGNGKYPGVSIHKDKSDGGINFSVQIYNNNNQTGKRETESSPSSDHRMRIIDSPEKGTEPKLPFSVEAQDRDMGDPAYTSPGSGTPPKFGLEDGNTDSGNYSHSGSTFNLHNEETPNKIMNQKPVSDIDDTCEKAC